LIIVGGTPPPHSRATTPPAPPRSYDLTIVSSGAAGGGLKDFGLFRNETVYTVYIDLADHDRAISVCTLQYAILSERSASSQTLVPPFAVVKPYPDFASSLRTRFRGQIVIVSAILSTTGEITQARILESPNELLSNTVLGTLTSWQFRPAAFNNVPVAAKLLLGIPIT
jgi:hypothetical protein